MTSGVATQSILSRQQEIIVVPRPMVVLTMDEHGEKFMFLSLLWRRQTIR